MLILHPFEALLSSKPTLVGTLVPTFPQTDNSITYLRTPSGRVADYFGKPSTLETFIGD